MNGHKCMQKNNPSSIPRRSNNDLVLGRDLLISSFWKKSSYHQLSGILWVLELLEKKQQRSILRITKGEFCMVIRKQIMMCHIQPQIPPEEIGSLEQPNFCCSREDVLMTESWTHNAAYLAKLSHAQVSSARFQAVHETSKRVLWTRSSCSIGGSLT